MEWNHNEFARLQLVSPATIYCLIPTHGIGGGVSESVCQNEYCEGHSMTLQDVQQALPMWAAQNWQATGQQVTEGSTGITREVYRMQASQPTTLYHTTHLGWSLVYIVDYEPSQAAYNSYTQAVDSFSSSGSFSSGAIQVEELHGDMFESCATDDPNCRGGQIHHMCGPTLLPNPTVSSPVHCDRDYTFGRGYSKFFQGRQNLWLIQDSHDVRDTLFCASGCGDTNLKSNAISRTITAGARTARALHAMRTRRRRLRGQTRPRPGSRTATHARKRRANSRGSPCRRARRRHFMRSCRSAPAGAPPRRLRAQRASPARTPRTLCRT